MTSLFLECSCKTSEHLIRVEFDAEERVFAVQPLLNPNHSFFRRVWIGVKYIFGKEAKFYQFEDCYLDEQQLSQLSTIIKAYMLLQKFHEKKKESKPERPLATP